MEGSGKWVLAVFVAIVLAVTVAYPHEVFFLLKFVWDIIVLNVQPFWDALLKYLPFHK